MTPNPHEDLDVGRDASPTNVKKAYRRRAKAAHRSAVESVAELRLLPAPKGE